MPVKMTVRDILKQYKLYRKPLYIQLISTNGSICYAEIVSWFMISRRMSLQNLSRICLLILYSCLFLLNHLCIMHLPKGRSYSIQSVSWYFSLKDHTYIHNKFITMSN